MKLHLWFQFFFRIFKFGTVFDNVKSNLNLMYMLVRLLKFVIMLVLFVAFPFVMLYELIEVSLVCSIYYIVTGNRYMDKYEPFIEIYFEFYSYLFGHETIDNVTFKKKYYSRY